MPEPHPHDDTKYMEYLHTGKEFFDDVHGKWLDKSRAIEARTLELEFFRKMGGSTQRFPAVKQATIKSSPPGGLTRTKGRLKTPTAGLG